jgi:hypothetical protein
VSPCCPQPYHLSRVRRRTSLPGAPRADTRQRPRLCVGARAHVGQPGQRGRSPFAPSALLRRAGVCPGPKGAKRSDSRGRRAAPRIRQGGRSAAQSARLAQACRKRRPRSPRSPALGRTHNDGAPVLKLGQGLFSEIATFTIESGPRPSVRCSIRRCCIERRCSLKDADTGEPDANRCMAISRAKSGRDWVCALRQNGFIRGGSTLVV